MQYYIGILLFTFPTLRGISLRGGTNQIFAYSKFNRKPSLRFNPHADRRGVGLRKYKNTSKTAMQYEMLNLRRRCSYSVI